MPFTIALELLLLGVGAYLVSRKRRILFLRCYATLLCMSILVGAALLCSAIVQGIAGVQQFITGYNPITRVVEGWSLMVYQHSLIKSILAIDLWPITLRNSFLIVGPITAISVPWWRTRTIRIAVCGVAFFATSYAVYAYYFIGLTGGIGEYLSGDRRLANDVLGRAFRSYRFTVPIDVFWALVVGWLSEAFFEYGSHKAPVRTVAHDAIKWFRGLALAGLVSFALWFLFAMRLPVQGRLVIEGFRFFSVGKVSYLSTRNRGGNRQINAPPKAIVFSGKDFITSLFSPSANVELTVHAQNGLNTLRADVSRVTVPSDLRDSNWRASLLALRGSAATDEWNLTPQPLVVIGREYQAIACIIDSKSTIAFEPSGVVEWINADRHAKDDVLGERQDGLTLSLYARDPIAITVDNALDGELLWHPETQYFEQDIERPKIFGDQKHSNGAEGIEITQTVSGVTTRLNPHTNYAPAQAMPYPTVLSLHNLNGGSYSIRATFGVVTFRDAEQQFEDLFPIDDAQIVRSAALTVISGFLRVGYNDPIRFQPGDDVRMESSRNVRVFRQADGSMVFEGTFDKLEMNNEPVGKIIWDQLSDSVRFWAISGPIGFLLVSLKINKALAERIGRFSKRITGISFRASKIE